MPLAFVFFLGVVNFALHKAVLDSGHPLLANLPRILRSPGGRLSLGIEFLLLLGTMLLVDAGAMRWVAGYAAYSIANAVSAWAILSRRL